jgi:hypothetical protein
MGGSAGTAAGGTAGGSASTAGASAGTAGASAGTAGASAGTAGASAGTAGNGGTWAGAGGNGGACQDPVVGAEVRITNGSIESISPRLAWDGTHVGMLFLEGQYDNASTHGNVRFTLLNPDGTRAMQNDTHITDYVLTSDYVAASFDLVWTGAEYGVLWTRSSWSNGMDVYFRRLGPDGALLGDEVNLTAGVTGPKFGLYSADLEHADQYGGYAFAANQGSLEVGLRFLGLDGTAAAAPVKTAVTQVPYEPRVALAPHPTSGWGLAARDGKGVSFFQVNPDSTITASGIPLSTVQTTHDIDIVPNGTDWIIGYMEGGGETSNTVVLQEGSTSFVPIYSAPLAAADLHIVPGEGGIIDLGWSRRVALGSYDFRLQRLRMTGGLAVPESKEIDIVPGATIPYIRMTSLVRTSTGLLAAWTDKRWGHEELYAAPVLGGCP